jgi:chromosome partitioning protein
MPADPPGKVVAVALQKGGVGKTTTVVNLGYALASLEKRVLMVDLDPQANTTKWLGVEGTVEHGAKACLLEGHPVCDAVVPVCDGKLDLLPTDGGLSIAELLLVGAVSREQRLRKVLRPVATAYDIVLIDTPPTLGLLTMNALTAADEVLVPVEASALALDGVAKLIEVIELVRENLNPELSVNGYFATRVDHRNKISHSVVKELRDLFGDMAYRSQIRENVRFREAPSYGQPIAVFDATCFGAKDYAALAEEFLKRTEGRQHGAANS